MAMQTLELRQGSEEWKEIRGKYCVASEAPVIMGASPHMTRDELLFLKSTGEEKEVNEWVEKFIFAKGHEVEDLARPIAEARLGEDLFPVTGINTVAGLNVLSSFDGLTMAEDNHWEHKQRNQELFEVVKSAGDIDAQYYWQLEHQMLVAETNSCIFACSDGTEAGYVEMVYQSVPERRAQLIEGWKLFLKDLENHDPKVLEGEIVGKAPMDLPALHIEISGKVLSSNLDRYKQVAMDVFANINTDLQTDEDFAEADKTIKWCESIESKIEASKANALGKMGDIDELFRTLDYLKAESAKIRINLKNLSDARKKARKLEIAKQAKEQFDNHIATLNKALGGDYMPPIATDFNAAMKGKRTVATWQSSANDEFTRARIEANRIASRIEENLELMRSLASEHEFLFPDKKTLVQSYDKAAFEPIIKQRIAEHKEKEEARIQAEAQRIADEKAEADRKAREAEEAEQKRLAADKEAEEQRLQQENEKQANSQEPVKQEAEQQKTVYYTSSPSSATQESAPDPVQPSIFGTSSGPAKQKPTRPSDDEIIAVLAEHYRVHESVVIGWLCEINLRDAGTRLVENL